MPFDNSPWLPWQGALAPRAHLTTTAPVTSLAGDWAFRWLPSPSRATLGFESVDFDDSSFDTLAVPSCWQMVDPTGAAPYGRPAYTNVNYPIPVPVAGADPLVPDDNPTGEYRRHFEVPTSHQGMRTWLRFEGVDSKFWVWVNGVEIGWSKGSRLTTEFDITDALVAGDNVLAVRVQQWSEATFVEDQDMWWLSGIYRQVSLMGRPQYGVDDVFVHADYDHTTGGGTLLVEVTRDGEPVLAQVSVSELGINAAPANQPISIPRVEPWTAETPRLYQAVVGTDSEQVSVNLGFRRVWIENSQVLVNGQPILFSGVNRHEWHPVTGRTLDLATMERDVVLMKQHNLNSVRTSHYPPDAAFLDLCDRYGLWVILECDLETHGFQFQGWEANPTNDVRWNDQLINRMQRTVERDKNHPSIICWSLGNESDTGVGLQAMAAWTKQRDPQRLVHYEGDRGAEYTDLLSQMYTSIPLTEVIGARTHLTEEAKKGAWGKPAEFTERQFSVPFVLCEYGHAMGNGPGELRDYQDLFDRYDALVGGFIWEWIDHGVAAGAGGRRGTASRDQDFYYGGDFGEELHDSNFIADGLLLPDRTPSPGLAEFKQVIAPVRIQIDGNGISLRSTLSFSDTSALSYTWSATQNGTEVASGALAVAPLAPGQTQTLPLPDLPTGGEGQLLLTVWARLAVDQPWAPAGHEVSIGQGELRPTAAFQLPEAGSPASSDPDGFTVGGARFDRNGRLVELFGEPVDGPDLDLFRAPTDNDRLGWVPGRDTHLGKLWEAAGLRRLHTTTVSAVIDGDSLLVTTRTGAAAHSRSYLASYRWRTAGDGISLEVSTTPEGEWPEVMPRVGLRFAVPTSWDTLSWQGLGPGESYVDSVAAVRQGRWSMGIDDLQTRYTRPQANGNRSQVSWFQAGGVQVSTQRPIDVTLKPWSDLALAEAAHPSEVERDSVHWLNVDLVQAPLGSGACGPFPLEKYWSVAEPRTLTLLLRPAG